MTFKKFDIRCQKSNSSNETPNVITVGVENYGLSIQQSTFGSRNPVTIFLPRKIKEHI
jgi:hypothetical protein